MKNGYLAVVLALTACSMPANGPIAPSGLPAASRGLQTGRPAFTAQRCPASVVYATSGVRRDVEIFDRSNLTAGPCGHVTGLSLPVGIFVDAQEHLWVADASLRAVFEFERGKRAPVRQLSDPNGEPKDVVVDDASKNVYVVEYRNDFDANALVEVYTAGSDVPSASLRDPDATHGAYGALDSDGNLYVSYTTDENKGQVDRWMKGGGEPQSLQLTLVSPGGIATNADGSLAVCDTFAYRCGVVEPGSHALSHVFGHMGLRDGGLSPNKAPWIMPQALALDRSGRTAYVVGNSITSWRYPGPARRPNHLPMVQAKIPGNGAGGIAVSPPARPGAAF